MTDAVRDHYQAGVKDQATLLATLNRMTTAELGSFDQFHVGGLAATAELAKRAGITPDMSVLDAGSGLGGPSRFLAETIGCRVTGVDLTPSYVAVATLLTERAGLAGKVSYQVGSILELPFDDGRFDVVWSQHVVMNIEDRGRLYRELRRVVKAGATFAFYDPYIAHTGDAPHYPLPWAETAATSTLLTKEATVTALEDAGFRVQAFDDVTHIGLQWLARQQQQQQEVGQATLGIIMGERMREMLANLGRDLAEGHLHLVMGICRAQ